MSAKLVLVASTSISDSDRTLLQLDQVLETSPRVQHDRCSTPRVSSVSSSPDPNLSPFLLILNSRLSSNQYHHASLYSPPYMTIAESFAALQSARAEILSEVFRHQVLVIHLAYEAQRCVRARIV